MKRRGYSLKRFGGTIRYNECVTAAVRGYTTRGSFVGTSHTEGLF